MTGHNFGLYKKLVVHFAVTDSLSLLTHLSLPQFKYAGARIEDYNIKYYRTGFDLMKTSEFLNLYSKISSFVPTTDYVLLLSMNREVVPNGRTILKTRNKVFSVLPIEIRMVREGDRVHTSVGLSIDPDKLEYTHIQLNIHTGVGELKSTTIEIREYKEGTEDLIDELSRQLDPIFDRLGNTIRMSAVDVWAEENSRNKLLAYIERSLVKTGLYTQSAEPFRIQLGRALLAGQTVRQVSKDDVSWDSPEDYEDALKQAGGSIEQAKNARKAELRLRWLLDECTWDQRLRELTSVEIANKDDLTRPNITLAMTEAEMGTWYKTPDKELIAQIELNVLTRWRMANETKVK